jgi:hypothetical protein
MPPDMQTPRRITPFGAFFAFRACVHRLQSSRSTSRKPYSAGYAAFGPMDHSARRGILALATGRYPAGSVDLCTSRERASMNLR